MVRIQLILRSKLKASGILEVVIAMVMILVVFTIAMMIFANVQRYSLSAKKVRAQAVLREALLDAEKAPEPSKRTWTIADLRVEEEIKNYDNNSNLYLVDLAAYDQNQEKITELREVVNADN